MSDDERARGVCKRCVGLDGVVGHAFAVMKAQAELLRIQEQDLYMSGLHKNEALKMCAAYMQQRGVALGSKLFKTVSAALEKP